MYDDFEKAINCNEVISRIVTLANNLNSPADFGSNVAEILKDNELISPETYYIVTGQL
ncbi:hypothetical protein [Haloimpatiens lingqiaonensis]|uniref:hypothetical protein n=1 Tax=Haloimpatiens lingqiaonensis TaxID=1380675 RepID=UPI00148548C6|nr:hypothetical protein [Haloimpatiens lingqiaonensis]